MNRVYIARPDTWFIAGSIVTLIEDFSSVSGGERFGLFRGSRRSERLEAEQIQAGEIYIDEEICAFDEFDCREE